jgi:hypothetical protein
LQYRLDDGEWLPLTFPAGAPGERRSESVDIAADIPVGGDVVVTVRVVAILNGNRSDPSAEAFKRFGLSDAGFPAAPVSPDISEFNCVSNTAGLVCTEF